MVLFACMLLYTTLCRPRVDAIRLNPAKLVKQPTLAETLKTIRDKGFQEFYSGSIAGRLLQDINRAACLESTEYCTINRQRFSVNDLYYYSAIQREPLQFAITGSASTMYTVPAPGSGSAMAVFLKLMQGEVGVNY